MYPEYASIGGKEYSINTDYRVAKECYVIINDETITDQERTLAVIFKLFGAIPWDSLEEALEKAIIFLSCGSQQSSDDENDGSEPDFDVNYDAGFIEASFQSCYGIDLSTSKMHWWRFNDLIQGLDKNCILSRVREIRNYDLNEIKDPTQRAKMAQSQEALKLPERISAEEQQKIDEFEKFFSGGD
ncbi:MAG: hypothetical protein J6L62_02790 [Clostridia bacterium]|nr:hypothetical protein [Clostridia bacterium]